MVIVHKELECPTCIDDDPPGALVLERGDIHCDLCGQDWDYAALVPTGRTRPYQFRTGRYPEPEPWRGARRKLFSGA